MSGASMPPIASSRLLKRYSLDPDVVKDSWEQMNSIDTAYGGGRMGGMSTFGINHTVSYPMPLTAIQDGEVVWVMWQEVPLP